MTRLRRPCAQCIRLRRALESLVLDADADTWTEEDSSRVVVTRENIERARAAIARAKGEG